MMILSNKEYDNLVETLARIESKLGAKKPEEKPRGGAAQRGVLTLGDALEQVMLDGSLRTIGQATRALQIRGLCKRPVKKHSVNTLLSKMFLSGTLLRPSLGKYQYKK